jgi:hypothetical protein
MSINGRPSQQPDGTLWHHERPTTRDRAESPGGRPCRKEGYMSNVVVFEDLTLDGAMQAPGRPDEDPRGGFGHGGRVDVQVRNPDAGPVLASVAAASAVTRLSRGT